MPKLLVPTLSKSVFRIFTIFWQVLCLVDRKVYDKRTKCSGCMWYDIVLMFSERSSSMLSKYTFDCSQSELKVISILVRVFNVNRKKSMAE